jgi:aspartyl-tRNA(Asn)/glutamyl-tRNA(Gln) amidotransferase subunit B
MERGEMRVEANISVSKDADTLGTKVEVKNLNSFKSVEAAIAYEVNRQQQLLEAGEVVLQETRGWDEVKLRTFAQRSKETAKDYRYFPDPDIPKMEISEVRLAENMPKLPNEIRISHKNLGIPSEQTEVLLQDLDRLKFLNEVLSLLKTDSTVKLAVNYLVSDIPTVLSERNLQVADLSVTAFAELMEMLEKKEVNSRIAKDLLPELKKGNKSPRELVAERGLAQVSDEGALREILAVVIAEHTAVAEEYRNGKEAAANFLVGQGMKATKGSADPAVLRELIAEMLST